MLFVISEGRRNDSEHVLFIYHISYPEDPLSLLKLCRVQLETRTTLVETYTVRQSNGCCD